MPSRPCSASSDRPVSRSIFQSLNRTGSTTSSRWIRRSYVPTLAISSAFTLKSGISIPGIAKVVTCRCGLRELAVEDVVEVLVGRDARGELLDQRILGGRARATVRDPRGELLQRRVDDAVQ
jgi:hypothetical protein